MLFRHEPGSLPRAGSAAPGGVVVERPPPGLARGKCAASPWTIALLGATLVVATLLYFALRLRSLRKSRS